MRLNSLFLVLVIWLTLAPLLAFSAGPAIPAGFEILSESTSGIDIRFNLPTWNYQSSASRDPELKRVQIDEAQYLFFEEQESLPIFSATIAIPYSGNANLSVVNTRQRLDTNIRLEFDAELTHERANGQYRGSIYPAQNIQISEPMIMRDFRIVTVNVYPFQYDQDRRELSVNENIDFHLSYDEPGSSPLSSANLRLSKSLESIYRGLILNYDSLITRDTVYQAPVMLVIYGNYTDATYQAKVNEYAAWKRQKGYQVFTVSTAVAGTTTTSIKNYIQNAYNTWEDRPEYIVLIGDVGGTIAIPTYTYSGSEGDYQYTWLAGGDILGDAAIGRISVSSLDEMLVYMAKLMSLERNISTDTAAWLNRMLLVGDSQSSGISTIYTNEYIHDLSVAVNPAYTYTELYQSSPSPATMNTAINEGVAFFNYRGYIGMSGWNSTYISQLNNSYKLFHAVIITCATGSFGGTSTTELVVRKGTVAQLGGAITAIGMATSSTHTPMNNCLDQAIFHGIYAQGMRDMGSSLYYSKLYLNAVYGNSNPTQAQFFAQMCNLIGDPTAIVYVGMPNSFTVSHPSTIPAQTGAIEVTVRNAQNQLVENAVLSLTNSSDLQVMALTGSNGRALLTIPTTLSGSITLTVSKNEFKPIVSTISITSGGIVYQNHTIDDDMIGNSHGDGNGVANSGESIELYVGLRNSSAFPITSISGDTFCSDPYITVLSSRINFGTIAPGVTVQNTNAIRFSVSNLCPDDHTAAFTLSGGGSAGAWSLVVPITIRAGNLEIESYEFIGATNNIVNPGDILNMTFDLQNSGMADLNAVYGILRSYDILVEIQDSLAYFGPIIQGTTVTNDIDPFRVYVRGQCVSGMIIPLELHLYNANGFSQTLSLSQTIGQTTLTDPLGQDAYGYFIYDDGDLGYPLCPSYSWIGIAPAEGGAGTVLNITDPGSASDEGDQTGSVSYQTVNLPFSFKFYGQNYSQITVSSNGFIAMGATNNSDWRNGRLPGPIGPNPMIAVFWDDLQKNTGSNIYVYYNSALHYYVVEWYNMISGYDRVTPETFQAILYDPMHYPTQSGDGQIKLQYKQYNNIDQGSGDAHPHGNFATIGIKNQNGTVGLEYTYNNQYPVAAKPLTHESALFITTKALIPSTPYLAIEQVLVFDQNENEHLEPGETAQLSIRLVNSGLGFAQGISATLSSMDPYVTITANSATYDDLEGLQTGYADSFFSVTVSPTCPSNHVLVFDLAIVSAAGSWARTFTQSVHIPAVIFDSWSIDDTSANANGVIDPGETCYLVFNLKNESDIPAQNVVLSISESSTYLSFEGSNFPLGNVNPGKILQKRIQFTVLASCPVGTTIPISINISSDNGIPSTDQENMVVGLANQFYNFESDNGGFVATNSPATGWEWGVSSYSGAYSGTKVWGTVLGGSYPDNAHFELVSPMCQAGANTQLTFRHRYNTETNYDGGRCMISTNNGQTWALITPTGGYSGQSISALGGPGYHGTLTTWTLVTFNLGTYAGQQVRVKWEFKTDGSVVANGWFIDDVTFTNTSSMISVGKISGTATFQSGVPDYANLYVSAGDFQSRTDASGAYQFSLPPAQYQVSAVLPGFSSTQQSANVSIGSNTPNLNLVLSHLDVPSGLTWLIHQGTLHLKWNPAEGQAPSAYRIYEKKGTEDWSLINSSTGTIFQKVLTQQTWYDYKVMALYNGNESLSGNVVHFDYPMSGTDVQPQSPVNPVITRIGNTNILNWEPVTQDMDSNPLTVYEYRVFASNEPGFQIDQSCYLGSTLIPEFTDTIAGIARFYKICAVVGYVDYR